MSFRQLKLFRRRSTPPSSGVSIGTVKTKSGLGLATTIRPDVAQNLGWKTGERIGVAFGEGPDEGMICFFKSPLGLRLYGPAAAVGIGAGYGGRVVVGSEHLPVEITLPRLSELVAHEEKDGSLLVCLPAWAYQTLPPVPLTSFRVVENRKRDTPARPPARRFPDAGPQDQQRRRSPLLRLATRGPARPLPVREADRGRREGRPVGRRRRDLERLREPADAAAEKGLR